MSYSSFFGQQMLVKYYAFTDSNAEFAMRIVNWNHHIFLNFAHFPFMIIRFPNCMFSLLQCFRSSVSLVFSHLRNVFFFFFASFSSVFTRRCFGSYSFVLRSALNFSIFLTSRKLDKKKRRTRLSHTYGTTLL